MGYFVRKRKKGWSVIKTYYKNGTCFTSCIPASEYPQHFFNSLMTIEEAKIQAKRLNRELHASKWIKKRELLKERTQNKDRESMPFLPTALLCAFEDELQTLHDPKRLQSIWRAARKLIKEVNIPPEDWKRRSQVIYTYFEKQHLSPDYAKKIIRVMNLWGEFYSAKTKIAYQRLICPSGFAAGRILRAYRKHLKRDKASEGLTPVLLNKIGTSLVAKQHHWLHISLWLGLRPQELRNLRKGREYNYFYHDKASGVDVLNILQTKLINLPEEDQWKSIPIIYPQQKIAAEYIISNDFEEPLSRTIKRYTSGNHHLYAGRKGFGPLMWELGHDVVEVSSWLGHKSIDRTYRDYMKWKRLKLRCESNFKI